MKIKYFYAPLFLLILLQVPLSGQLPDSTFGIPTSFDGPPRPGVTGCDFGERQDRCQAALHLEDGRILLAGYTSGEDETDFALVRLLPDGHYDEIAGPQGQMRLDLGYTTDSCLAASLYQEEWVLMGGCVKPPGQEGYALLLTKVDVDGLPDPAFGNEGLVLIDLPTRDEMITHIRPLPDGKILIGGNILYEGYSFYAPDSTDIFVGRLLPNGQVDSTFGTNGFIHKRFDPYCRSSILGDLEIDGNGHILITGGSFSPYPGEYGIDCPNHIVICRSLPDGQPDPSFGENGVVELSNTKGRASALLIEEDGKIVITGLTGHSLSWRPAYTYLSRLLPNGQLDPFFGAGGQFIQAVIMYTDGSEPVDVIKVGGKYYVGVLDSPEGFHIAFGLLRLTGFGAIDTTFGDNGVYHSAAWLPFYGEIEQISTIDSQSIYLTGTYSLLTNDNMMISKVNLPEIISSTKASQEKEIRVFPNPSTTGKIFFDYTGAFIREKITILLFDIQGRLAYQRKILLTAGSNEIDISGLPNGLYSLEVQGKYFRHVEKLVVQH